MAERAEDGKTAKRRVSVRVAGRFLMVLTDRDPDAVKGIERELNDAVEETVRMNPRMATREGRADAVMLCAVDAMCRAREAEEAAEKTAKKLRAQEEKYRELLRDYAKLEARLAAGVSPTDRKKAEDGAGGADEGGIPGPPLRRLRESLSEMAGKGGDGLPGTDFGAAEGEE